VSERPLVVAIGPTSRAGARVLREVLGDAVELALRPDGQAALDVAPDAAVAIVGGPPLPHAFLAGARELRLVYRLGSAHAARAEADALRARGVVVAGPEPGLSAAATAEHALALLLALAKRLPDGDRCVRSGGWTVPSGLDDTTRELGALTVGIVGLGRVGAQLARLLEPFGARVLYTRRAGTDAAVRGNRVELPELLRASDAVSLHVRAAPGRFRFGAAELGAMRPGSWFVNTARPHLVDHEALLRALGERLAGAALDVFPHEPHVDRRLRTHPRVLLSPHTAGRTAEAAQRYYGGAARAALAALQGATVAGG